jgi:hypothetical protein
VAYEFAVAVEPFVLAILAPLVDLELDPLLPLPSTEVCEKLLVEPFAFATIPSDNAAIPARADMSNIKSVYSCGMLLKVSSEAEPLAICV